MTSNAAQNEATTNYLFDFVYLDRDKIGSYYAQLFNDGVLTSIKRSSSSQDTSVNSLGVGAPKLLIGGEMRNTEAVGEGLEQQFDTAWTIPLEVINELDRSGYIVPDLHAASLGQIVMFKGRIQIIDLRMVQELWEPILTMQAKNGQAAAKTQQARKAATMELEEAKQMIKVISKLPHTMQMRAFGPDAQLWSTLNPSALTINNEDLAFKHGATIPGEWMVMGILDAKPDSDEEMSFPENIGEVEGGMLQLMVALRFLFGRKLTDYGITPIAVFRPILPAPKNDA
jgi:hypothetical protein